MEKLETTAEIVLENTLLWSWVLTFIGALITNEIQLSEYGQKDKPLTRKAFSVLFVIISVMVISFILFFFLKP